MRIFGAFSGQSEYLLLHCNTSRSRPPVLYACPVWHSRRTVAQSKGLEFLEDGTEHYLPWRQNVVIANVKTLSDDKTAILRACSFSSDVHALEGRGSLSLDPPMTDKQHIILD